MSIGPTQPAMGTDAPLLVVDIAELYEHLHARAVDRGETGAAYSDHFSWLKTDIAANVGGAVAASRLAINSDCHTIGGWAFRETTNLNPASLVLHDGNNANGEVIVPINLAINESTRDFVPRHGIRCSTGRVFVEIVSGSVAGVIYWR